MPSKYLPGYCVKELVSLRVQNMTRKADRRRAPCSRPRGDEIHTKNLKNKISCRKLGNVHVREFEPIYPLHIHFIVNQTSSRCRDRLLVIEWGLRVFQEDRHDIMPVPARLTMLFHRIHALFPVAELTCTDRSKYLSLASLTANIIFALCIAGR
jgi:hypothetical protein